MRKHDEAKQIALELLYKKPLRSSFESPLQFLLDEHMRQRALCALLDNLGEVGCTEEIVAKAAIEFLKSDFALHILDEEEDLFPLLLRRVRDDGQLEHVIGKLKSEHAHDREVARLILIGLGEDGLVLFSEEFRKTLHAFALSERRHLIVENAIVLPLAKASLGKTDLVAIGTRMAARRGLSFQETNDAR